MAIFNLDPENGNDANDGTTFANRWKTLTSGATAARIAPGDEIRIMASADPYSPASATWTDNSGTVTWAAQKNLVIDNCETNWTASTNITCTLSTTRRKQGSNGQGITPASGFTTGKMAYRTLPAPLDLSTYEQVTMWFRYGALTTAGQLELKLCSDTLGDTAVNTLALPAGVNGQWCAVVLNNAAALGASIASIALYATADPSTTAMYFDNIVACKAAASTDCVTHKHVIGKNTVGEPDWYSILSIDDSSIVIGGATGVEEGSSALPPRPYRGTTESVTTYLLLGTEGWTTSQYTVNDSGTDGSLIHYSGGWNRTDMSTQTGETYFQGSHVLTNAITLGNRAYVKVSKIGALNYSGAIVTDTGADSFQLDLEQAVGCGSGVHAGSANDRSARVKFRSIQGMTSSSGLVGNAGSNGRLEIIGRRVHGQCNSSGYALTVYGGRRYAIDKIDNNGGWGVNPVSLGQGQQATLIGTTFQNNSIGDVGQDGNGILIADGCSFTPPSFFTGHTVQMRSTRHGGVATDNRIFARYWTLATATDRVHSGATQSWKVSPNNVAGCSSDMPAQFPLAKLAVNASALVTIKCWLNRDNTGISAGIRILGNSLPGVGEDDIQTLMTAAIDTWEEITLTFTPTVAGVVEVFGIAWGGTTYNAWFGGPITLSQV